MLHCQKASKPNGEVKNVPSDAYIRSYMREVEWWEFARLRCSVVGCVELASTPIQNAWGYLATVCGEHAQKLGPLLERQVTSLNRGESA